MYKCVQVKLNVRLRLLQEGPYCWVMRFTLGSLIRWYTLSRRVGLCVLVVFTCVLGLQIKCLSALEALKAW